MARLKINDLVYYRMRSSNDIRLGLVVSDEFSISNIHNCHAGGFIKIYWRAGIQIQTEHVSNLVLFNRVN